jgi:hypothetical protein
MSYALIIAGAVSQYPYGLAQLLAANPGTSFPAAMPDVRLAEYGIVPVALVNKPAPSDPILKNVVEVTPTLVGQTWTQTWGEVDATAEQIANRQRSQVDANAAIAIKADAFVRNFIAMTPAEVKGYISANVTADPSVKKVLEKAMLLLLLLARREFRD